MIIVVSGTPGTGKTEVAKALAKSLGYTYLDVKALIKSRGLSLGHDLMRNCEIIDPKELNKVLIKLIKQDPDQVIDSHLGHYLPKKYVDCCIITTCKLKELDKRLKKRGYSKNKIRENLDSEIFETCKVEAEGNEHKVIIVDTSGGFKPVAVIKQIGLKVPR